MAVNREAAVYNEKSEITEYVGNPLIAALPKFIPQDELLKGLLKLPPYHEQDRTPDSTIRLNLLTRINTVHVPYSHDLFISRSISRCINSGYLSRNPVPFSVTSEILEEHQIKVTSTLQNYLTQTVFPIYGFSVLGISGVGKSCSVQNALMYYPQVIDHTEYHGHPFHCAQLVWLKVNCPSDASQKGLCASILREIDNALGTNYRSEVNNRVSKDILTTRVSQCLRTHHLGILVIDDIQNLCGAKKDSTSDLLSFFIYLMETLAIPVVMVGTPKVLPLFQQEFQLAKRATGDGTVRMNLMEKDSNEWTRYITQIWRYQFLKNSVPLTQEMKEAFYRESVGNPFLCSLLYKLVQDDAITSREETFSVADVKKVADEKLCITASMRANMLKGNDVELRQYEYLWASAEMPGPLQAPEGQKAQATSAKPSEEARIQNMISAELVTMFKIRIEEANKIARDSVAAKGIAQYQETLGFAITLCQDVLSPKETSIDTSNPNA